MSDEKDDITYDVEDDTTNGSNGQGISVETLTVQKRKALEQRDEWKKKYEDLEISMAKPGIVPEVKPTSQSQPDVQGYASRDELDQVKFVLTHKELEAEDVDELVALAKGKGIGLKDAYETKTFKAYYKEAKAERDASASVPQTNRSGKYQPPKPPEQMTREEHMAWEQSLRS